MNKSIFVSEFKAVNASFAKYKVNKDNKSKVDFLYKIMLFADVLEDKTSNKVILTNYSILLSECLNIRPDPKIFNFKRIQFLLIQYLKALENHEKGDNLANFTIINNGPKNELDVKLYDFVNKYIVEPEARVFFGRVLYLKFIQVHNINSADFSLKRFYMLIGIYLNNNNLAFKYAGKGQEKTLFIYR